MIRSRTVVLVVAVVVAACATVGARSARERELERQLSTWQSTDPLDQGWQEARRLVADRGYPLAEADAEAAGRRRMSQLERLGSPARATVERGPMERTLETGWGAARDRYAVRSLPSGDGWRIVFWRVEEAADGRAVEPRRDLELELDLVRRVDPAGAERIEAALAATPR